MPSYIGTSIENKPAYLKRNEKLHKQIHEQNAFTPIIEQAIKLIDKWLEFKHSQTCPNDKTKTINEVLEEIEKQNIVEEKLDDLMMAMEIKNIGRNGIRFLKSDYFDEALYGIKEKAIIKYSLFDLSYIKVFSLKGEFICKANRVTSTHPLANQMENALPDLNLIERQINKKEKKDISYEYFIDGAREYIKFLDNLKEFFKNYRFSEITQNIIINFQNKKVAEGFSIGSIKRFLGTLSAIYYKYSDCDTQIQFTSHNDLIQSVENPILTNSEIKEIIKGKIPELWILCLGITPAELEALEYNDINFENNTVNINKFFYKTIQKHRRTYKIRTLKLHLLLLKNLKLNSRGKIIANLDIKNFEVLQNTHVKLLLEQNVPINIIYKNMGYQCLNDFENRFRYLLPNKLEDNFDILQNYL